VASVLAVALRNNLYVFGGETGFAAHCTFQQISSAKFWIIKDDIPIFNDQIKNCDNSAS